MTASTAQRFAFKRSKYFAKKVKLDGITFDSKLEAKVYGDLKILERAGKINALDVHPRMDLHTTGADGIKRKIGAYELDFRFFCTEAKQRRYVDVKGHQTSLSDWKRKHAMAEYGIVVELWRKGGVPTRGDRDVARAA